MYMNSFTQMCIQRPPFMLFNNDSDASLQVRRPQLLLLDEPLAGLGKYFQAFDIKT